MPKATTRAPKDDTSPEIRDRHAAEGQWAGVDDRTEVLTRRGWLGCRDLDAVHDEVLTLDTSVYRTRFEPITALTIGEPANRLMRFTELGGFSAFTTHAHRWPTCGEKAYGSRFSWRRVTSLPKHARLFRVADVHDQHKALTYSDSFVELVAWYWCEGWKYTQRNSPVAYISQSSAKNPQHCSAITSALNSTFPGQWKSKIRKEDDQEHFRLWVEASKQIFAVTGLDKAPTPEFLTSLTQAQARLLVQRCLDADGATNWNNGGQRVWYQVSKHGMSQFQMACALAGIATNAHESKDYGNRYGRPPIAATLLTNTMAVPWLSLHVKSYGYKPGAPRTNAIDEWREHNGSIWNVQTPSGTWLARRNWSVYFTGGGLAAPPRQPSLIDAA